MEHRSLVDIPEQVYSGQEGHREEVLDQTEEVLEELQDLGQAVSDLTVQVVVQEAVPVDRRIQCQVDCSEEMGEKLCPW